LSVNGIRALNEFFLEVGWRDTLKASDFTLGDYKWPSNSEERRALITKINKQISHLTDERTLVEQEKIGDQDRTALYELLVYGLPKAGTSADAAGVLRPSRIEGYCSCCGGCSDPPFSVAFLLGSGLASSTAFLPARSGLPSPAAFAGLGLGFFYGSSYAGDGEPRYSENP
jgi:hypothetical protein